MSLLDDEEEYTYDYSDAENETEIKEPKFTPKSQKSPRFCRTASPSIRRRRDEMETYAEEIVYENKLPPVYKEKEVIKFLDEHLKTAAQTRNYDEANFYQRALNIVTKQRPQGKVIESNQSKIDNANRQINEINNRYDEILRRKEAELRVLENRLNDQISREEQEYESRLEDENFIRQYSKPSKDLLDLRKVEKIYAAAGMWLEAGQSKNKADNLEKIEEQEARYRVIDDMRIGYETMKGRHQKMIDGLNDFREKELRDIELKRNRELKKWNMYKRREDVANPIVRRSDAVLFTPRQRGVSVKTGACTLNIGKLKMKQIIRTKQQNNLQHAATRR